MTWSHHVLQAAIERGLAEKHLGAEVAAAGGFVDEVIEPCETHARVAGAFAALAGRAESCRRTRVLERILPEEREWLRYLARQSPEAHWDGLLLSIKESAAASCAAFAAAAA